MKKYKCLVCNSEFKSNKESKGRIPKYCSRVCYSKRNISKETRKKQSESKKGIQAHNKKNREFIKCKQCNCDISVIIGNPNDTKFCSLKCYHDNIRLKENVKIQGINHPNYKDGKYSNGILRGSKLDKQWTKSILLRDNHTCKKCGSTENINVHHINSYKDYPELRHDMSNGVSLCIECHLKEHGKIYTGENTNKCPDCGKKIKKTAKRCVECRKINTLNKNKEKHICNCCGKETAGRGRLCKSCSAKQRKNNFGRNNGKNNIK